MSEAVRLAGWGGIVLFLFGLLSFGVTGAFDLWIAVHLVGGGTLMAAAAALNLAGVRRTVAARGTRERLQALSGSLVFAAILVVTNVAAARHPWSADLTENRIHTLSEKSASILAGLTRPVEVSVFLKSGDASRGEIEPLLRRFAAAGPKLTWRVVDPEQHPELADQLGVQQAGTLVARSGEAKASLALDEVGAQSEGALAALILKVSREGPGIVYTLTGHGEPQATDLETPAGLGAFARALQADNLEMRPLLLSTVADVPADAGMVLVAGPVKPLLDHETEALRRYLGKGGRVMLLLEPGTGDGLEALLADARLAPGDDMIVDQTEVPFLGARLGLDPIVEDFPAHPITRRFRERILLLQARTMSVREAGGLPGAAATVVARTRDTAWAESGWREALRTGRVAQDAADAAGPLPVAVAVTFAPSSGRVFAMGDAQWLLNGNLGAYFNQEFALNVVHWMTGTEDLIAEPPRGMKPSRLDMTESEYVALSRFSMLLLPEALLIIGIAIWRARRAS